MLANLLEGVGSGFYFYLPLEKNHRDFVCDKVKSLLEDNCDSGQL